MDIEIWSHNRQSGKTAALTAAELKAAGHGPSLRQGVDAAKAAHPAYQPAPDPPLTDGGAGSDDLTSDPAPRFELTFDPGANVVHSEDGTSWWVAPQSATPEELAAPPADMSGWTKIGHTDVGHVFATVDAVGESARVAGLAFGGLSEALADGPQPANRPHVARRVKRAKRRQVKASRKANR